MENTLVRPEFGSSPPNRFPYSVLTPNLWSERTKVLILSTFAILADTSWVIFQELNCRKWSKEVYTEAAGTRRMDGGRDSTAVLPYSPLWLWSASGSPLLKAMTSEISVKWLHTQLVSLPLKLQTSSERCSVQTLTGIFHGFFSSYRQMPDLATSAPLTIPSNSAIIVQFDATWSCSQDHKINDCREIMRSTLKGQKHEGHIQGSFRRLSTA